MQKFRLHTDGKRWVSAMVIVVGGVALSPWQLKAQTQAPAQEGKPAQSGTVASKTLDKRTIQVGAYTLKLLDANSNFSIRTIPGTGGPASSHTNLNFSLEITADNKESLLLLKGVENLHGQDDSGRAVRGPEGLSYAQFMPHLQDEMVRRQTLSLQTEDGAKSLKTLEGNLMLETGIARTVTFSGEELHPDVSKQIGRATMSIDFFKLHKDGEFRLYAVWEAPHFNPPVTPLDRIRPMPWNHDSVTVEVIGADGVTYKPHSSGSSSSGYGTKPLPPGVDDGAPSISMVTSYLDYGFHVPEGFRVKSIVCHFVEQQGDNRNVPFKFTDIPIAEKVVEKVVEKR
jgi:hypothetical protein